jgi:hypothetical protein
LAETRFVPNPGLAAQIANSPQVGAVLLAVAQRVEEIAIGIAPVSDVGSPASPPGEYKASFHADVVQLPGSLAGRVYNDDPIAIYVEVGTSTMDPQAVLHRALEGGTSQ